MSNCSTPASRNVPPDIRELRVRADAGFGFNPVFEGLEVRPAQYAVVARLTQAFKRLLPGLPYESVNRHWEMAEFEHRLHGWPQARRFVVARRFLPQEEPQTTLFMLGRYVYRAWVTNMNLTPAGVWHFYDGRAGMEPRICERAKIMHCARFRPDRLPLMRFTWKSFALPTTWSQRFNGTAWKNLGRA